jgi:DNA helicase-2/ATP-dependent DNA helicase PcrA
MIFGQTRYGLASRFIGDLPRTTVRHTLTPAAASMREARASAASGSSSMSRPRTPWSHPQEQAAGAMRARQDAPARAPGERYVERDEVESDSGLRPGARVEHKTFGVGTVLSVDGATDPTVSVKFSGWGPKSIKARFLRLAGG